MALPPNFGHWEHLQDTIRREQNKVVARYFRDLGGIDWEPDISDPRKALRTACRIDDQDTDVMTLIRLYLFYEVLGYGKKRLGVFYGMPALDFQESFEGRPQVFLFFSQDRASTPDDLTPITAEISFRLMDETAESITPAKALSLANKIKAEMSDGGKEIYFNKGKNIVNYNDRKHGLALQIYSTNEAEGEKMIKKILAIRGVTFDSTKQSVSVPKRNSENLPKGTTTVYGKSRKKRRWRPNGRVIFRYAYLYVHGLNEVVPLVDATSQWVDALVHI
ncbi:hypothetical protein VF14_27070 [Nostoc linckia z18]|uniref:Uncharacterized protein n=2 Tax=Nostoc linckia TaxID=92942 RepID=A0A9Q5Z695_NOSLI|nr:hypothetical protein [Nostoc linckia]PHK29736.1 hypothetical protein VF12_30615 [Nostoc linckia z15]PHK42198.1 hypothetical protein VF13_30070 [Nostoc linckia z16]PHJ59446.1 hypothetical protein VF02_24880 [Nostoc linckia z1]PHJ62647.1 hypothetical protein VF05_26090 [Nostoc linckia z3]PHJ68799.1 hypothetical protein VF03_24360 [Nostoc linckia z2]